MTGRSCPACGSSTTAFARPDSGFCSATVTFLPRNPYSWFLPYPTHGPEKASLHCARTSWKHIDRRPGPPRLGPAIRRGCRQRPPRSAAALRSGLVGQFHVAARHFNLFGGRLNVENAVPHIGARFARADRSVEPALDRAALALAAHRRATWPLQRRERWPLPTASKVPWEWPRVGPISP